MSGPIVRTGTTPAYGDNWERIFGGTATKSARAKSKTVAPAKAGAKTTKNAAAKAEKAVEKAAAATKSVIAKATGKAKAGAVKTKAGKK